MTSGERSLRIGILGTQLQVIPTRKDVTTRITRTASPFALKLGYNLAQAIHDSLSSQ